MQENSSNIVPAFGNSLYNAISDAAFDTFDYGFDQLAEEVLTGDFEKYIPIVQEVPIIKYFVAAGKLITAVRDRMFLKKTLKFIAELNHGTVNTEAVKRRQIALAAGEQWVYDELEILISTIEQLDRSEKAKIISEIYRTYLNGEIDRKTFDDFCSITEKLFSGDIIQIRADYEEDEAEATTKEALAHGEIQGCVITHTRYTELTGRLLALGLMRISAKVGKNLRVDSDILEYTISNKGKEYAKILRGINFLGIK